MYFSIKKHIMYFMKLGYNIKCISYVLFESWDKEFNHKNCRLMYFTCFIVFQLNIIIPIIAGCYVTQPINSCKQTTTSSGGWQCSTSGGSQWLWQDHHHQYPGYDIFRRWR